MSPATGQGKRPISITVDAKVHARVSALATNAGVSLTAYATMLFEAAYSARIKDTGDVDLDTAVSRVALLFGSEFDVASIRQTTGLSEVFVGRTISAWRKEMLRGPAPAATRARA